MTPFGIPCRAMITGRSQTCLLPEPAPLSVPAPLLLLFSLQLFKDGWLTDTAGYS